MYRQYLHGYLHHRRAGGHNYFPGHGQRYGGWPGIFATGNGDRGESNDGYANRESNECSVGRGDHVNVDLEQCSLGGDYLFAGLHPGNWTSGTEWLRHPESDGDDDLHGHGDVDLSQAHRQ